jgi:hypothetical protein
MAAHAVTAIVLVLLDWRLTPKPQRRDTERVTETPAGANRPTPLTPQPIGPVREAAAFSHSHTYRFSVPWRAAMKKSTRKTTPTTTRTRTPLPPARLDDLHLRMLLAFMDGTGLQDSGTRLGRYIEGAHRLLSCPAPFEGTLDDSIEITDVLLRDRDFLRSDDAQRTDSVGAHARERDRIAAEILNNDNEGLTTSNSQLFDLMSTGLNDAMLIGAAVMYTLLKSGAK